MIKKETVLAVVAGIVLLASLYFMYTLLFPSSSKTTANNGGTNNTQTNQTITGNIDQDTLDKVKAYKDYGAAALDNIGRVNPFGPLN